MNPIAVIVAFLLGVLVTLSLVFAAQPYCPTEDSCKPDYQDHWYGNYWTGAEETP